MAQTPMSSPCSWVTQLRDHGNFSPKRLAPAIALSICLCTISCVRVPPHQRERLAHPAMQSPVWTQQRKAERHFFEVREGSKGADGAVGGGCGCN
jgi:hypothetical protein